MNVSVPKETAEGERRVALVPEVVQRLTGDGLEVTVEPGAGDGAHHPDPAYEEAGRLGQGSVLIGFLQPLTASDTVRGLADRGVTSFAMEAIPRITRAQSMDALSSQ